MDDLVASTVDPDRIAAGTSELLAQLLQAPEFLEPRFRVGRLDAYTQHLVHVHPEGLYSVVSLVWEPGQSTPIHDHRCWCVVGVLEGREQESRYTLHSDGADEWLVERESQYYPAGSVCSLVPPGEDIHRVGNADDRTVISIHVYGDDILKVGSSINRRFSLPVRAPDGEDRRTEVSWRVHDFRSANTTFDR
jgi:predicted metal-dependent enzyme (double-stranded beta helix superfamily)